MTPKVLSRLQVVLVVGYHRFAEMLCQSLAGRQGINIISIHSTPPPPDVWQENVTDPFAHFLEKAERALEAGNTTVVVAGFPHCEIDAYHLRTSCPNLRVVHLDDTAESITFKAIPYNFDGMTHDQFLNKRRKEEEEIAKMVRALSPDGKAHIIKGGRRFTKQIHTLEVMISSFIRGEHVPTDSRALPEYPQLATPQLA